MKHFLEFLLFILYFLIIINNSYLLLSIKSVNIEKYYRLFSLRGGYE